ncbi:uncharacterized protein J3D65DRAFT_657552 [Phyllosticta citribraziliensis]|uniref:Zinc finger CCCH-type TRM13 domain-containing protein n=1 Tax=Phyllosticta citribraziliensis TaxID=989973 RepID=A0ABR1LZ79_9PEZI
MSKRFNCQSWLKNRSRPCGNPARRGSKYCASHEYISYPAPGSASSDEYTDGEEEKLVVLTDDSSTDDNSKDDDDDELASDVSASQKSLAKPKRGTKAKDLARHSRKSSNRSIASNKKVSSKRTGGGGAPDRLGTSVAHATKMLKAAFLSRFEELEMLASSLEKLKLEINIK